MDMKIIEEYDRYDNFKKIIRQDIVSRDDFRSPVAQKLYDWWMGFQPDVPRRADFDISRHWKIAPSLYLIEVIGPGQYLSKLNGESVVDIIGVSLRGHEVCEESPLIELRRLAAYLNTIVAYKKCRRCTGITELTGAKYKEFESVDCPLLDDNGNVCFILGAISLLD